MPDEATLIAQALAGNKTAFGELYDLHIKQIYTFIYYKTHHKETAEDLVSQTFLKAYNHFTTYDVAKGPFIAWLYRIARNTVVDHYRAKKPTEYDIEDAWDLAGTDDVLGDVHNKLLFAEVQNYFKDLTAEQRDVLTMRIWQEMSYQEIAAALGKSEGSCKMVFSRAIAALRNKMPLAIFVAMLLGKYN